MMKTRQDAINDKLLALEMWSYRARHLDESKAKELREAIKEIWKIDTELQIFFTTNEEDGRKWEWWE